MADANGNGCYLVSTDGVKLPIRRSVLMALKRAIEEKISGSVTIHLKAGGTAAVETRIVTSD